MLDFNFVGLRQVLANGARTSRVSFTIALVTMLLVSVSALDAAGPYVIGNIPPQQVAQGATLTFQVNSPGAVPAFFSYTIDPGYPTPQGTITLYGASGIFKYVPSNTDKFEFHATFTSTVSGSIIDSQSVDVVPLPSLQPETDLIPETTMIPEEAGTDYGGQTSNTVVLPVAAATPGILTIDASGHGQGAIVNQEGTVNSSTNPAPAGSICFVYATGEGQTSPSGVDGKSGDSPAPNPILPVTAKVGGLNARVLYASGVTGLVAEVLQVNVEIPQGITPSGAVPILLSIGGTPSQAKVTVSVR
jgi:uncharacterized protein (TIGR03437 family)